MNKGANRTLYVQLGKVSGLSSRGFLALAATIWMAIRGAEALADWSSLGLTFGMLEGAYMGFILIPATASVGFVLGWVTGLGP